MSKSRVARNKIAIIILAFCSASFVLAAISTSAEGYFYEDAASFFVIWAMAIGFVCALVYRIKLGRDFKKLVARVSRGSSTIDEISKDIGIKPKIVRKRLEYYIRKHWLSNINYDPVADTVSYGGVRRPYEPARIPVPATDPFDLPPAGVHAETGAPLPDPFEYTHTVSSATAAREEKNREQVIVYCKACGAQNVVVRGEIEPCEYCGSKLKG